jgi:RNA methyltransferase, TrmH family
MKLTSFQNPKVKVLMAQRRGRERAAAGIMLVEGYEELMLALASGVVLHEVYYCPELMGAPEQLALLEYEGASQADRYELTRPVFEKVAYRQGADGWLAVAPRPATDLKRITLDAASLVLVCEGVEKPGNLGAMLRTADAVGASGVVAVDMPTDWGNPNIVRASKGAIFSVPVAEASAEEVQAWLREAGVRLVAAAPAATQMYTDVDLTGPVAIAVGTEKQGLTASLLAAADIPVRIPMAGRVDSLNVATSAALLLYEAVRQRSYAKIRS